MAPPVSSPESPPLRSKRSKRTRTPEPEPGPVFSWEEPTPKAKGIPELDSIFKGDLMNIKALVTCSICDQLLYEPWTLGCGHTYCYTCLCNWFVPNKYKKTCPECRATVRYMPAPAYVVKQMVEIFTKRRELMPSDESVEQHETKRKQELADVEKDKKDVTPTGGLFKGLFPPETKLVTYDEDDGVFRCPHCFQEYEEADDGSRACAQCHVQVEYGPDYRDVMGDFHDEGDSELDEEEEDDEDGLDEDVLDHLELGLDDGHHGFGHPNYHFQNFGVFDGAAIHQHQYPEFGEESEESEDSDDDLSGFIAGDDEDLGQSNVRSRGREVIDLLSDDDSDEGGAVSNGRNRRRMARVVRDSSPSVVSVSNSSVSSADMHEQDAILQSAGWSPLHQDDDDDDDDNAFNYGYPPSSHASQNDQEDESDTETMVGNGLSDDERSMRESPETSRYEYQHYENQSSEDEHDSDDDHINHFPMDRDGDTEMSSDGASRASRSVSVDSDAPVPMRYAARRAVELASSVTDTSTDEDEDEDDADTPTQNQDSEDDSDDDDIIVPQTRRRHTQARANAPHQPLPRMSAPASSQSSSSRRRHGHGHSSFSGVYQIRG